MASTPAAIATQAAKEQAKNIRQRNNENATKFFAAGILGILLLCIIFHWIRFIFKRYTLGWRRYSVVDHVVGATRAARSFLTRNIYGFTSRGHALVFLAYLTICLAVSFFNIDWSSLVGWAKRLGWVAIANVALSTFLALKNTPVTLFMSQSYERLNILHQLAGYMTVFFAMLHAVVYISAWSKSQNLHELLLKPQIMGIVAGISMLIILGSALVRKHRYELFYVTHVIMFILVLITLGMHRPDMAKHTYIIVVFCASIWLADRILRISRTLFFSFRNRATVTALPLGGTRISLRKAPSSAVPGSHCFLWIPKIRKFQTHPFTIVSTNPLELVVAAHDGFTRDLYTHAVNNPGQELHVSVDGPYGALPDFTSCDKLILVAGGSGGSFAFGVALNLLRKLGESKRTSIELIWVVRQQEKLEWFSKELQELSASPLVRCSIYSTHGFTKSDETSPTADIEKFPVPSPLLRPEFLIKSDERDIEKFPASESLPLGGSLVVHRGRPNVALMIDEIISATDKTNNVIVAACGPGSLMQVVRKTVAENIQVQGPGVDLHCEQFDW